MPPAHRALAPSHPAHHYQETSLHAELAAMHSHLRAMEVALEREARALRHRFPSAPSAPFLERFGNEPEDIARDTQRVASQLAAVRAELKRTRSHICLAADDFHSWMEQNFALAQQLLALRPSEPSQVAKEVLP